MIATTSSPRTSWSLGIVPTGRSRHRPYRAACATAIAACSGKGNDGIRVPASWRSCGRPFVDIHVVATGIRPPTRLMASTIAWPISAAFVACGGM
jgi:hypothetical protein